MSHPEANRDVLHNLRFGFGELLKNGEGDIDTHLDPNAKTLKGRYIVRVGWDDVRGWLGEVCISYFDVADLKVLNGIYREVLL